MATQYHSVNINLNIENNITFKLRYLRTQMFILLFVFAE